MTAATLKAEDFFTASWTGRGEVSNLFRQTLRSFDVSYRGASPGKDGVILCEERVVYDHGAALDRSWHLKHEGGTLVGLEPLQGGRMRIENTRKGFVVRYDRFRLTPGQNVTRLNVRAWMDGGGRVHMQGWTQVLGVVPLFKSHVVLSVLSPGGEVELRPASS